jgi:hypothetical protein
VYTLYAKHKTTWPSPKAEVYRPNRAMIEEADDMQCTSGFCSTNVLASSGYRLSFSLAR